MNTNKFCPSCGEPVTPDMKSCPNCGEILVDEGASQTRKSEALGKAQAVMGEPESSMDGIQIGSRSNVVGDIMGRKIEAQSMTENTHTHVEANTTNCVSTSNVDNSQKVVNSNTNNVTYNIIYQNTGQAGPQMPNPGPDIPGFNPAQPKQANSMPHTVPNLNSSKGFGAKSGAASNLGGKAPDGGGNSNGSKMKIIAVCVGLVIVIGLYFALKTPGGTVSPQKEDAFKEQVEEAAENRSAEPSVAGSASGIDEAAPKASRSIPVSPKTPTPAAEKVVDSNYEKGMKAYQSKEGLEAIQYFKSSGSAESNYMLGVIYEQGCGNVATNAMMARKYYKAAAKMGSEAAKAKL